jgi:plastocyanin
VKPTYAMKRIPVLVALIVLPLSASASEVVRITIHDLVFSPAEVSAKVGDTIEWVNSDFVDHTATAKDGTWDVAVGAGKSAQFKLVQPGTVAYYCKIHPNMTGTIHVVAK